MKKLLSTLVVLSCVTMLSACQAPQSQNTYDAAEVGKQTDVEFGIIKAIKHVKVQEQNSGVGTLAGAGVGGVAGSALGGGRGSILTAIGGAVIGGLAGNAVESNVNDKVGIQYVIKKENGKLVTIVQNIGKDDEKLHVGQRVMIQTTGSYQDASGRGIHGSHNGQYQRVLPADDSDNSDQ